MPLNLVITELGRDALINAANTGTAAVTVDSVGLSATAHVPAEGDTVLPGEFARVATVGGAAVAENTIHLSIRDDSARTYNLRAFALYLSDGTLFAIYGQSDPILSKTASSIALLAADIQLVDVGATAITFGATNFTSPDATTAQKGLVELATNAEAVEGTDPGRAITPASLAAALIGLLLDRDGAGSGVDADLLDGKQGEWYTNIVDRLGYTPVKRSGDTMTGQLVAPSVRAQVDAPTPNAGTTGGVRLMGNASSGLAILQVVNAAGDVQWGWLSANSEGELAWNGSPLLLLSDYSTGSNANGRWWKTPDGAGGTVIEQQGSHAAISGQQVVTITFPTPFATTDYDLQLTAIIPSAGDYDNFVQEIAGTRTVNSVSVYTQDPSSGGSDALAGFRWRAKGY